MCFLLRRCRPPASTECSLRKRKSLRSNWVAEDEGVWNNIPRRCWLWAGRGRGCNTYNRWEDQPLNLHKSTCFRPRPLWVMLSFNIWTAVRFLTTGKCYEQGSETPQRKMIDSDRTNQETDSLPRSLVLVSRQVTSCFKDARLSFNKSDTLYGPPWSNLTNLQKATGYTNYLMRHRQTSSPLTDDDEGVVDVNATKAVGGFTDVGTRVVRLHLLDLQAHAEDTETDPAAVDVAPIFGPHNEGWRVSFYWTRQLNGTPEPGGLSVNNLLRHPWRSWGQTNTVKGNSVKYIFFKTLIWFCKWIKWITYIAFLLQLWPNKTSDKNSQVEKESSKI